MLKRIKNFTINHFFSQRMIVQYSIPRSGSTLIWNMIKLFSDSPLKVHSASELEKSLDNYRFITTIRHPLDVACSIISVLNLDFDKIGLTQSIKKIQSHSLVDLKNIIENQDSIILRYENFVNDYEYAFKKIECFFGFPVSSEKKDLFKNKFSLHNVKLISEEQNIFKNYDPKTLIHGNHISSRNGKISSYKECLSSELILYAEDQLSDYIEFFKY